MISHVVHKFFTKSWKKHWPEPSNMPPAHTGNKLLDRLGVDSKDS